MRERAHTLGSLDQALSALESIDDLDLVATPDVSTLDDLALIRALQSHLLAYCDDRNDRFALLDPQSGLDVAGVLAQRDGLTGTNGALYYPQVIIEPRDGLAVGAIPLAVPPCGHIAGLIARVDAASGVHKAPANEIVSGALDLTHILSDKDHATLNQKGVNAIRAGQGRGIRVMGARTLSTDPAWTFVSTRRVLLTVCRWVSVNLAPMTFEPNDFRLWARVGRELTAFCDDLFGRGALRGRTPQEAFLVKCDAETNPPEERQLGRVVTELRIAPVLPNEFVLVRIIQGDGNVTVAVPGGT